MIEWITKILSVFTVLVGGVWAVFEYYNRQEEARIEKTIPFLVEFRTGPTNANWQEVVEGLDRVAQAIRQEAVAKRAGQGERARLSLEDIQRIQASILLTDEIRPKLMATLTFFEFARRCAVVGICARQITLDLFGSDAAQLHQNIYPLLLKMRADGYRDLGTSLCWFRDRDIPVQLEAKEPAPVLLGWFLQGSAGETWPC